MKRIKIKTENKNQKMTTNKGEIEWKEFVKVLGDEGIDPTAITSEKVSFKFQKTKH